MLKTVAATLALLIFALPVRAQPNAVEAILIKQFLICDGALAAGALGIQRPSSAITALYFALFARLVHSLGSLS